MEVEGGGPRKFWYMLHPGCWLSAERAWAVGNVPIHILLRAGQ